MEVPRITLVNTPTCFSVDGYERETNAVYRFPDVTDMNMPV